MCRNSAGRVLRAAAPVLRLQGPRADRKEPDRVLRPRQQRYPQARGVLYGTQEDAGGAQRHGRVRDALFHVVSGESHARIAVQAVWTAETYSAQEAGVAAALEVTREENKVNFITTG